ncbi:MAG TPA: hypothetical protein VHR66_06455 [Gemmataceae bacterium]|nr:hypothetical protein [Gemmataceae bacterium]
MRRLLPFAMVSFVAAIALTGCHDPRNAERDRFKAEADAARAEQARTTAEMEVLRAELVRTTAELVRARAELDLIAGRRPEPLPLPAPETTSIEKQFSTLHANYNKGAITLGEWGTLKTKVIEQIPKTIFPTDRRTLGQRMIDLHGSYNASDITLGEWGQVKTKLIAQLPSPGMAGPNLDTELGDLKRAYDANAMTLGEWTEAKAMVAKR